MKKPSRNQRRLKIHGRIRNRISGTAERPRLSVFRSLRHTYAQLIDDAEGKVLISASTLSLGGKKLAIGSNLAAARSVGKKLAEEGISKGFGAVVFDRSGYIYHGRVRALAEAAREAGLKF